MTISEIKSRIYKEISVDHFNLKTQDGKLDFGHCFLSRENKESFGKIGFSIDLRGHQEANWSHSFYYMIFYPTVNNILNRFFPSEEFVSGDPMESILFMPQVESQEIRKRLDSPEGIQNFIEDGIYYEDRLVETCAIRKEIIEKYAIPFFDRFATLQAVNDEVINNIPQMELGSWIPGEMALKKMIIMFLCKNPSYREYKDWLFDIAKIESDKGDPYFQQLYKTLPELERFLKTL